MTDEQKTEQLKDYLRTVEEVEVRDFKLRGVDAAYALELLRNYLDSALRFTQSAGVMNSMNGVDPLQAGTVANKVMDSLTDKEKKTVEELRKQVQDLTKAVGQISEQEEKKAKQEELQKIQTAINDFLFGKISQDFGLVSELLTVKPEQVVEKTKTIKAFGEQYREAFNLCAKALGIADKANQLTVEGQNAVISGVLLEKTNRFDAELDNYVFIIPRVLKAQSSQV